MRQAVMTSPGVIELRSVPDARAGRGQVLLKIGRIGVCGSDVHVYHGTHPFVSYPWCRATSSLQSWRRWARE